MELRELIEFLEEIENVKKIFRKIKISQKTEIIYLLKNEFEDLNKPNSWLIMKWKNLGKSSIRLFVIQTKKKIKKKYRQKGANN